MRVKLIVWAFLLMTSASTTPVILQALAEKQENPARPAAAEPAKVARLETEQRNNPLSGRVARIDSDGRGHFVADAKLNGRRIEVLVDTGATLVAINETTARRIGIRLSREDFKYKVNTANGTVKAANAVIDEIEIGRVRVRDVPATVLSDKALDGTLLGMSFLKQLKRFEVADGTLVLTQ